MASDATREPSRVVLEGVSRVSYAPVEGSVEVTPFPSSLRACLAFMGEDFPYEYIMATSGAAFRLLWNADEWDMGQVGVTAMTSDVLAPFSRAFEAVGRSYDIFANEDYVHRQGLEGFEGRIRYENSEYFRQRIVDSIQDRRRPVVGLGVVGPPECCVVTGYDDGGEALIGWSYFQEQPEFGADLQIEESGQFRKGNWFQDTAGVMIIGEKAETPPLDEVYRRSLKWATRIARTPSVRRHYSGLAAYEAWAEALVRDEDFPADDPGKLIERMMVHLDAQTVVSDGRWCAARFLELAAEHLPAAAEDLRAAAVCYRIEHDLVWKMWGLVGGPVISEEHAGRLADPDVRQQTSDLILEAGDHDAEAIRHIERALAK